jgi:hypothetical protein
MSPTTSPDLAALSPGKADGDGFAEPPGRHDQPLASFLLRGDCGGQEDGNHLGTGPVVVLVTTLVGLK